MTLTEKARYASVEDLKSSLAFLQGKKFKLDCGHCITFNFFLGNDIVIYNGKKLKIICLACGQ